MMLKELLKVLDKDVLYHCYDKVHTEVSEEAYMNNTIHKIKAYPTFFEEVVIEIILNGVDKNVKD